MTGLKINRCILGVGLYSLMTLIYALSAEETQLLKKDSQIYQAWSLSRNYYFGTTLKQDKVYALAWQQIYFSLLPSTYPEKEKLLAFYKQGLSAEQLARANQITDSIRKKYGLTESLTEAQLYQVFALKEANNNEITIAMPSKSEWSDFDKWLVWLNEHNYVAEAMYAERKKQALGKKALLPVIYGQVIVKGPEPVEKVASNISLSPSGFFIGHVNDNQLIFSLAGYKTITVPLAKNQPLQGIPPVILQAPPTNKNTGVVGRVKPWIDTEHGNILLRLYSEAPEDVNNPWNRPVVPLTVTNNGEFYATGLSPARYELVINTAGLSTVKQFMVQEGEIRGLSLIDLTKGRHGR